MTLDLPQIWQIFIICYWNYAKQVQLDRFLEFWIDWSYDMSNAILMGL